MRGKKGPVPPAVDEPAAEEIVGEDNVVDTFEETQAPLEPPVEPEVQPELFSEPSGLIFRNLQVPLTEERLTELHAQLGEICSESLAQEELLEATKDKIKALKTEMQEVRAKIRWPYEFQEIECRWEIVLESNAKQLVRTDTQEVIDTKPLSEEDRAKELERVEAQNAQPVEQVAVAAE